MVLRRRHLVKVITWRILSAIVTGIIVWILTRDLVISSTLMSVDAVIKFALHYGHERLWYKTKWGIRDV